MTFDIFNLLMVAFIISDQQYFIESTATNYKCLNSPAHYNIENGNVVVAFDHNSEVYLRYTCNKNYKLNGPSWSRCVDGKWTNPPPVCKPNCNQLKLKNARVTINEGSNIAIVNCNQNYSKQGYSDIYCRNGIWQNHYSIRCTHNNCLNDPLYYNLQNGTVTPAFTFTPDVKLEYSCVNDNYELIGFKWSTCFDGKWSNPPPVCKLKAIDNASSVQQNLRASRCPPLKIKNGQVTVSKNGYIATVQCNLNYSNDEESVIFCSNGYWMNSPHHRCIHNDCQYSYRNTPLHFNLDNGNVYPTHEITSDVELEYRCKKNYELKGFRWSFCTDGKWSNPPPVCEVNNSEYEDLE
ncbi:complement factor H-related protein 5-like [Leptopilina boulardi]|uniref:complement factor H-related protein 5-like n=1 Tax=Leptopilina boulardi TaxID=63433 RepID=UPI0021F51A77|nr:complement factor H-related protein 5-like [Leptopilina boulardi]